MVLMKPLILLNKNLSGLITWFIIQSKLLYPQIVSFYQGKLEKEKLTSLSEVSGVMINERTTIMVIIFWDILPNFRLTTIERKSDY